MSTTLSCGQCGAPLRADQDWCSLCYATVEAAFDPLTAPLDEVVGRNDPPAPTRSDSVAEATRSDPVAEAEPVDVIAVVGADRVSASSLELNPATPVDTPDERPTIEVSDLDVMLSMLAAEHRRSDPSAGIAERLQDKSTRIAVMFGGMAIIGGVVFLVLTVLGTIL